MSSENTRATLDGSAPLSRALDQSQQVQSEAVHDALASEIEERHHLENKLSASNAALRKSRAEQARFRSSALHDTVTGLPNLTLFNDRLRTALIQAKRHVWRVAVMFIDLDGFKAVNDTHGHAAGDEVLRLVGQRMQSNVRGSDTVSHRSGDEFLLLMLEAKDEANVAALAGKIAQNIAQPCHVDGVDVSVSASIGIAIYPEDGHTAEELLKNADIAMYASKRDRTGPMLHGKSNPAPKA